MKTDWQNGAPPWRQPVTVDDVIAAWPMTTDAATDPDAVCKRANELMKKGDDKSRALARAMSESILKSCMCCKPEVEEED